MHGRTHTSKLEDRVPRRKQNYNLFDADNKQEPVCSGMESCMALGLDEFVLTGPHRH